MLQQRKEIGPDELLDFEEYVVARQYPVEDVVAIDDRARRQYLRRRIETAARDDRRVREPQGEDRDAEERGLEGEIARDRDDAVDMRQGEGRRHGNAIERRDVQQVGKTALQGDDLVRIHRLAPFRIKRDEEADIGGDGLEDLLHRIRVALQARH